MSIKYNYPGGEKRVVSNVYVTPVNGVTKITSHLVNFRGKNRAVFSVIKKTLFKGA